MEWARLRWASAPIATEIAAVAPTTKTTMAAIRRAAARHVAAVLVDATGNNRLPPSHLLRVHRPPLQREVARELVTGHVGYRLEQWLLDVARPGCEARAARMEAAR